MREFPVVPKFDNKKISNHYGGEDFALLMKDTKWLVGDKYSLSVLLDSSNFYEITENKKITSKLFYYSGWQTPQIRLT